MATRKIPRLYDLRDGQVLEVVRDLHSVQHEYKIIVAVDPHEIFDYCFPINPIDDLPEQDLQKMAESQAALHYLFSTEGSKKPTIVLLPEYEEELRGLLHAINEGTQKVYDAAEMIAALVRAGNLSDIPKKQIDELESIVQTRFQFLLAVLMGVHSLGVDRMKEIYDKRLTKRLDAVAEEDRNEFRRIWDGYSTSQLYAKIFNLFQSENTSKDSNIRTKAERANRYDASAIDRLIYLNTEADSRFERGLKNRYLFLYLSTTEKSRKAFTLPEVKSALPTLRGGRQYPFWRNRHQVLAYLVSRSNNGDENQRINETVRELRSLNVLLRKVKAFERVFYSESNDCRECVFEDKTPTSCALANYCRDVKLTAEKISKQRETVNNWALFQQISSYAYLLDAKVLQTGYGVYLELFRELLESRKLKDIALERMYHSQLWISRASEWTFLSNQIKEGFDPSKELALRTEKDEVVGIDQCLPTKPRFTLPEYKEIFDLIAAFIREPKNFDLFERAYRKFIDLEQKLGQDDEYDLLKCYLYLSFGSEKRKVHLYIKNTLSANIEEHAPSVARCESLYILCWSARRFGLYHEADDYVRRGLDEFTSDPRFFHGNALNIYAWLSKEPESCPYRIIEAIVSSEKALELYENQRHENTDVIAATYNNLAYFLADDVRTGIDYDRNQRKEKLHKGREYLLKLKNLIDKDQYWDPTHPEFFHTEAFLEYQEVLNYWVTQELSKSDLERKLRSAQDDIRRAIDIYDGPKYRELKDDIEEFLQKIASGVIK